VVVRSVLRPQNRSAEFVELWGAELARQRGVPTAEITFAPEAPTELVTTDGNVGTLSVARAKAVTGWEPTPMAEWIATTVRWALAEDEELAPLLAATAKL
jgi:hypothetical protein